MPSVDHRRRFARLAGAALALLLVLFGGCPLPEKSGVRDGILVHSWTPVSRPPSAPWSGPRTRLYTYVLSGDAGGGNVEGASSARVQARRALGELLQEVQAAQRASSIHESELLRQANQFVIPARGYTTGMLSLEQYDFGLAAEHLNRFRLALPDPAVRKQLEGLGPFFIATLEPLDELVRTLPDGSTHVNANVVALLVDMSGSHPKSMPAYVNAFKDAVRGEVPTQFTTLSPLRARFASAVVDLGEAVPFVAEAYAGTLKTFSGARP
jgi:hypothetical protein